MIPILSDDCTPLIEEAARERPLLAFDFDGTLAPLVENPRGAAMRDQTRSLLGMAAICYPCAVLSGRDRADVLARTEGIPLAAVIGNHGIEGEDFDGDARTERLVRTWSATLEGALRDQEGIEVERKAATVAIHYRRAEDRPGARARILELASALPDARVFGGHEVLNVAPADAPTKGDAVERLAQRLLRRSVVFVGDDLTDEDAFQSPVVALGIRVGRADASAARFFVPDQGHVDDLLRAFVAARGRLDGLGDRWLALCGTPKNGGTE